MIEEESPVMHDNWTDDDSITILQSFIAGGKHMKEQIENDTMGWVCLYCANKGKICATQAKKLPKCDCKKQKFMRISRTMLYG